MPINPRALWPAAILIAGGLVFTGLAVLSLRAAPGSFLGLVLYPGNGGRIGIVEILKAGAFFLLAVVCYGSCIDYLRRR